MAVVGPAMHFTTGDDIDTRNFLMRFFLLNSTILVQSILTLFLMSNPFRFLKS
jgi:hypothetical protein